MKIKKDTIELNKEISSENRELSFEQTVKELVVSEFQFRDNTGKVGRGAGTPPGGDRKFFRARREAKTSTRGAKAPMEDSAEQSEAYLEDYFVRRNKKKLYRFILEKVEKPLIECVLNKTKGNKLKAAKILGINRNTLHSKIKRLGIEITRWKGY